jgi:hypothetical protein
MSGCLDQLRTAFAEMTGAGGGPGPDHAEAVAGLRERLSALPDPRTRQGRRHSLVSILLITICALAADKNGYTHIEAWARDAPTAVLDALGVRMDAFTGARVPPDESTIRDVIGRIDATALTGATACYLADRSADPNPAPDLDEREARRARALAAAADRAATPIPPAFAADGKRLAGARRPDGTRVNLLSLVDHATATTLAQHEIAAKTNEIPELATLLAGLDLTGSLISVDALHTQRDTATMIAGHDAYYFMTQCREVKNSGLLSTACCGPSRCGRTHPSTRLKVMKVKKRPFPAACRHIHKDQHAVGRGARLPIEGS